MKYTHIISELSLLRISQKKYIKIARVCCYFLYIFFSFGAIKRLEAAQHAKISADSKENTFQSVLQSNKVKRCLQQCPQQRKILVFLVLGSCTISLIKIYPWGGEPYTMTLQENQLLFINPSSDGINNQIQSIQGIIGASHYSNHHRKIIPPSFRIIHKTTKSQYNNSDSRIAFFDFFQRNALLEEIFQEATINTSFLCSKKENQVTFSEFLSLNQAQYSTKPLLCLDYKGFFRISSINHILLNIYLKLPISHTLFSNQFILDNVALRYNLPPEQSTYVTSFLRNNAIKDSLALHLRGKDWKDFCERRPYPLLKYTCYPEHDDIVANIHDVLKREKIKSKQIYLLTNMLIPPCLSSEIALIKQLNKTLTSEGLAMVFIKAPFNPLGWDFIAEEVVTSEAHAFIGNVFSTASGNILLERLKKGKMVPYYFKTADEVHSIVGAVLDPFLVIGFFAIVLANLICAIRCRKTFIIGYLSIVPVLLVLIAGIYSIGVNYFLIKYKL